MSATRCNTLQHTATHCNTPQHTATHYSTRNWDKIRMYPTTNRLQLIIGCVIQGFRLFLKKNKKHCLLQHTQMLRVVGDDCVIRIFMFFCICTYLHTYLRTHFSDELHIVIQIHMYTQETINRWLHHLGNLFSFFGGK